LDSVISKFISEELFGENGSDLNVNEPVDLRLSRFLGTQTGANKFLRIRFWRSTR
jgi:hypothetical protein